jgi:fucose permease
MDKRIITSICYMVICLFAVVVTLPGALLLRISSSFSVDLSQMGVVYTCNFIGFIIFLALDVAFAHKWSRMGILTVSIFGYSAALLLVPCIGSFALFCLLIIFAGGFGGIMESQICSLIYDLNPVNKSYYVNMTQVFFGIGACIGPLIAAFLIERGISWRLLYFISGLIAFLLALVFCRFKMTESCKPHESAVHIIKSLAVDRRFLVICGCIAVYTGMETGVSGWISTFLTKSYHLSIIQSSLGLSAFWFFMTVGRLLSGVFSLRFEIRKIIISLAVISFAATFLLGLAFSEILVWISIGALGLSYSSLWPLILSYGSEYRKTSLGIEFPVLVGCGGIGGSIIPYLLGLIGMNAGMGITIAIAAGLFLIVIISFIRFGATAELQK